MKILKPWCWIGLVLIAIGGDAQGKTSFAYVANISSNTVSVINTSTKTVVATIPVGDGPWGVAISPNGDFAYVVNNHDTASGNSISVIKTATNTVVATVKVQSVPFAAVVTPNGRFVYVTNADSNTVSVISTATNTVIATVPVGQYPVGVAVAPNGGFVYVANNASGSVSVISTANNRVMATIPVGSDPIGVAISPNGFTAYVTNSGANGVSVISTAGNGVTATIPIAAGPFGEALTLDGRFLYVADSGGNTGTLVSIIDTSTLTVTKTITVGIGPEQIAFTPDGLFAYVTNITSNNVSVIATATGTVTNTIPVGLAPIGVGTTPGFTVATSAGGLVGDGRAATQAAIGAPYAVAQDATGNLYISDNFRHRIRKITPAGLISTVAGNGISGYNGDNIPASTAMLSYPNGLVFDKAGNLLVADGGNSRIRRIDTAGNITTVVGNGVFGYSGDGGLAVQAEMTQPFSLILDRKGNLYTSDLSNQVIRKIDASGIITTYAGNGIAGFGGDGGPATSASLNFPRGLATDAANNLYIADTINNRVRVVNATTGIINTFAGNGSGGASGDGGPAVNAAVGRPAALTLQTGVLYIGSAQSPVRDVVISTGIINSYAGSSYGYDGDGHSLLNSKFAGPRPFFDSTGKFLVADSFNGRLRKAVGGVMRTIAGGYLGDGGNATAGALVFPSSLRFDNAGNYYIADSGGNRVRKVSANGEISTVAGTGINGYSGDGGQATLATLSYPYGAAADSRGNLYISDNFNNVIRKVSVTGTISTFVTNANFSSLGAMIVDSANNLYVVDSGTCVVWKITTPAAIVSVAAGVDFICGYNGDNISATIAQLNAPLSLAVDTHGNLYIADTSNNRMRKVNSAGVITTLAGDGICGFVDDVAATEGELCLPFDVAVNTMGTLYIADTLNLRIRQVSGAILSTYVGAAGSGFNGDGLNPLSTDLDDPIAVAVSPQGAVYFLDDVEQRVRVVH
jgi:YVTN family beta-propeller protein